MTGVRTTRTGGAGAVGAAARTRGALVRTQRELFRVQRELLTDPLTGVGNRAAVTRALSKLDRGRQPFAVLLIDLDKFKPINDRYGHATGDRVLIEVAARLRSALVGPGVVARLGGDEFVIVGPSPSSDLSQLLAVDAAAELSRPVTVCGVLQITVGASIGVVHVLPGHGEHALGAADQAMYRAKTAGGGMVAHRPLTGPVACRTDQRPVLRVRDLHAGVQALVNADRLEVRAA